MNTKLLLVAAACALAACGGGNAPALTSSPVLPSAAPSTKQITELGKLNDNLNTLKSYRAKWVMNWSGKDKDDKPVTGSLTFLQEVVSATSSTHILSKNLTSGKAVAQFEVFSIGTDTYSYYPDRVGANKCISASGANSPKPTILAPWGFFGSVSGATLIGKRENANDVLTDHYLVNEDGSGFPSISAGSGEIWIAQEGAFVVKYSGNFKGSGGAMAAEMRDGEISWDYDLTEINKLSAIPSLPSDCKKPATSLPLPDDAANVRFLQGLTLFQTKMDIAELMPFYKTKLSDLGYTLASEKRAGESASMVFNKDNKKVDMLFIRKDDLTQVTFQESP